MATLQNLASDLEPTLSSISVSLAPLITSAIRVAPITAAPGAPFSAMYVFGDSLSDTGNVSLATAGLVPVSPPYANRSFTNGSVWAQDLAQSIGLPTLQPSLGGGTDFAYGGARTGQTPEHTTNATDLTSQYDQFKSQVSSPQTGALYALWIGSNDVLDIANDTSITAQQQQTDVADAVNNEVSTITALIAQGARDLLVLDVPDIGNTPSEQARGTTAAESASSLASLYDSELFNALQPFEANSALKVNFVDTFSVLNQVIDAPWAYGFSNVTDPVWTGNVTSSSSGTLNATGAAQNQFLFFDSLHPTAQAHNLLASGIAQGLTGTAPSGSDFNGDSNTDLLWQNTDSTAAVWLLGGTTSYAGGPVSTSPGLSWHVKASGDFNGDGKSDILWQNDDGTAAVWLVNGTTGIAGGPVWSSPGASWHVIDSGDFNGDGKSDILWQNDNGTAAVWLMNGLTGIAGGPVWSSPGASWHVISSGDFNGDGKSDILWQNDDGTAAVWLMNGTTGIAGGTVWSSPGASWHVIGSGDFNGDGKSDILWQNDDGTPAVWLMNGLTGIAGGTVWSSPGPSWHVIGSGDYNGDGKSDILWQNDDGTAAVWLMNGTTGIGEATVGTTPGANWHVVDGDNMRFISSASDSGTLSATSQSDEFVFSSFATGPHSISGFDPAHDLIEFSKANFADFSSLQTQMTASAGGTLIALDSTSSLLIQGVLPSSLHSSDFVFA